MSVEPEALPLLSSVSGEPKFTPSSESWTVPVGTGFAMPLFSFRGCYCAGFLTLEPAKQMYVHFLLSRFPADVAVSLVVDALQTSPAAATVLSSELHTHHGAAARVAVKLMAQEITVAVPAVTSPAVFVDPAVTVPCEVEPQSLVATVGTGPTRVARPFEVSPVSQLAMFT